jgi:hypothetical protein
MWAHMAHDFLNPFAFGLGLANCDVHCNKVIPAAREGLVGYGLLSFEGPSFTKQSRETQGKGKGKLGPVLH